MAGDIAKSVVLDRRFVHDFEDDEILKMMADDWSYSTNYWVKSGFFENFRRWDQCYNMVNPVPVLPTKEEGIYLIGQKKRANNFYPLITVLVDTVHAVISSALFPTDDFFFMKPSEVYDNVIVAEAAKDFLVFDLKPERANVRENFDLWLRQAIMLQWSVARVGYRVGGRNIMVGTETFGTQLKSRLKKGVNAVLDTIGVEKLKIHSGKPAFEIKYDETADQRPEIEVLNTLNTRPDPKSTDFDDQKRYFMWEKEVNWSYIKANLKTKRNPDGLYEKKAIAALETAFNASYTPQEQQLSEDTAQKNKQSPDNVADLVTLRFWSNQFCEFVADKDFKILLRRRKKDGWDFAKMVYLPRRFRWEGYCIPERAEKLNYEINAIANSRRDNVNFIIDAILLINENLFDITKQDTRIWSGKAFLVAGDPKQAMAFERPPDATQAATEEIKYCESWAEKVISTGENAQGQYRSTGSRTATETEVVANALTTRMKPIISRIERNYLRWLLIQIMKQEQLHVTDEIVFTVLGPEGVQYRRITPQVLSLLGADLDITPIGSQMGEDRFYNRLEKLETTKLLGSIAPMTQIVDWKKLTKQILESAKFRGVSELIVDDPEFNLSIPPEYENIILQHEAISIRDADKHEDHIRAHQDFLDSEESKTLSYEVRAWIQAHLLQHQEALQETQQTQPGPKPAPPIFQGMNTANALSATNPASLGAENQPTMPGTMQV